MVDGPYKKIEVTIENGEVNIETFGFEGDECTKETAALENALGIPSKRSLKKEYRAEVHQNVRVKR